MKLNLDTQTIFKLVLVVCLVSILVYLFVFQPSISSVKLVHDKRKSIETTFDEDSVPDGCKTKSQYYGNCKDLGPRSDCSQFVSYDSSLKKWFECDSQPSPFKGDLDTCVKGTPCKDATPPPSHPSTVYYCNSDGGCSKELYGSSPNEHYPTLSQCFSNCKSSPPSPGPSPPSPGPSPPSPGPSPPSPGPSPSSGNCKQKLQKWFSGKNATSPKWFADDVKAMIQKLYPPEEEEFIQCVNDKNFLKNMGWTNLTDLNSMFRDKPYSPTIPVDISNWDTSEVTDMSEMFENVDFAQFPELDISKWDTGSVTDMSYMFMDTPSFDQDISGWDTSSVTDMKGMFYNTTNFNGDIGGWDTSKVRDMNSMFQNAKNFNHDISGWDTSSVEYMNRMFEDAQRFNQDIGGWDVSSVTDMHSMFEDAQSFNQDIGGWDTSLVTNMNEMFHNAQRFNQDLSGWKLNPNIKHYPNIYYKDVFKGATSMEQKHAPHIPK
jgi:surface protein